MIIYTNVCLWEVQSFHCKLDLLHALQWPPCVESMKFVEIALIQHLFFLLKTYACAYQMQWQHKKYRQTTKRPVDGLPLVAHAMQITLPTNMSNKSLQPQETWIEWIDTHTILHACTMQHNNKLRSTFKKYTKTQKNAAPAGGATTYLNLINLN